MKARKSALATMVLADPAARHQLRQALAQRVVATAERHARPAPTFITFTDSTGRARKVTAELMTPTGDGG